MAGEERSISTAEAKKRALFSILLLITFFGFTATIPLLSAKQIRPTIAAEQTDETRQFGITYTTIQEIIPQLLLRDKSLIPIASEIEKALLFLEEKTHSYEQISDLQETTYEGEEGRIAVECIQSLRSTVIYLPESIATIGFGHHKRVSKVIFIHDSMVYIAAHCSTDQSAIQEIKIVSALHGMPGIVPYFGAVRRDNNRFSIFLLYCNKGSLSSLLQSNEKILTLRNQIAIARDIAIGLHSLHKKKYIHFDLHAGNCFIMETSSGAVKSFVADFGHTFHISDKKKRASYITRRRAAPESLLLPLGRINRYKTDVYAFGTVLYKIIWNEFHPWRDFLPSVRAYERSSRQKRVIYKKIIHSYKNSLKSHLKQYDDSVIGREEEAEIRFKKLAYQLLHYNPRKRATLEFAISELNSISALL